MLDSYQDIITDSLICEDQYILKEEAETEEDSAEKYSITSLETVPGRLKAESVSVFGIAEDSDYVKIDFADDKSVYISSAYAKKNKLEKGDKIRLEEKYADGEYEFTVGGIYEYAAQLAVFMPSEQFNDVFDKDSGYFNGYFSNKTIDDIDEKSVAAIITEEDMTKTSRQLKVSMGGMANIVRFFALIMFILIIYLISKIIIEKNSQSISMTKILGYNNREINGLYTLVTSIVSILSMLVTEIIALYVLSYLVVYVMSTYPGYIEFNIPFYVLAEIFGLGVLSYAVVAWLLMQKIKRIPMTDALKNAE
jgi:putative ABC transport system permease protein